MKKTLAAIVMGTVLAVGSSNAAIVFGNLGATGTDGLGSAGRVLTSTGTWNAVGFTAAAPDIQITTATIGLSGDGVVRLDLYTDVAGSPGVSITSATQSVLTTAGTPQKFNFNLNSSLTAGTSYWLVARLNSGLSATWVSNFDETPFNGLNSSGWTSLGGKATANSGGAWTSPGSAQDLSVSVTAIPEPGTWAAMAILAGGAAFAGWRRRQQQVA